MAYRIPVKRSLTIPSSLRPLTHKNFGFFWLGAFLSSVGFWIQSVGQGWQVLKLTNSPLLLGLVSFASLAPNMILSLFGGVMVDRLNRRTVLLVTQMVYMSTALVLGILTSLGMIAVWHILVVAVMNGICSSVGFPAWQTFIGDLLPEKELKQGIALNSTQFNLSRVVGPALGGLCVGLLGIAGSYYLNGISFVAVIIPLLLMHSEKSRTRVEQQSVWQGLCEGLKYATHNSLILLLLVLLFFFTSLVFPYLTLLPVFADNVFHIGAQGLGALNSAAGVGALTGSLLSVFLSQYIRNGQRMLTLLCVVGGTACVCFAFSGLVPVAMLFLFLLGGSTVMAMIVTNTTIQTHVPAEMRGRVVSLWVLVSSGIAPLGNLVAGWVAQEIGAPLTLTIGGTACVLLVLAVICVQIPLHSASRMKTARVV
ncbi:MAG: MFS transporter [Ktedonobacteraceae bacterium]|nr:MFS transporter [Ktedonobacteraceae bacterium]